MCTELKSYVLSDGELTQMKLKFKPHVMMIYRANNVGDLLQESPRYTYNFVSFLSLRLLVQLLYSETS